MPIKIREEVTTSSPAYAFTRVEKYQAEIIAMNHPFIKADGNYSDFVTVRAI